MAKITIEKVRELAKKKGIKLEEFSTYNDELVSKINKDFQLSTDGLNVFLYSKKNDTKKPLPIKRNAPHVFGNICVLSLSSFADFYMANYDLEAQKQRKEFDRKCEEMARDEKFFCTGCGSWHPIQKRKGYMWCGC